MRRLIASVVAIVSLVAFFSIPAAQAMTIPAPAGLAALLDKTSPAAEVGMIWRRVRQCGPYGCGWRRQCWDDGYGYGYYGGGVGYRYGGGRWRTWNGCPPNWTVQDGVCKPYRGY